VVPEARGRAQRQIEEANAYRAKVVAEAQGEAQRFEKLLGEYQKAPEVTRERLYLDSVERVYRSSSKVLVDVEGGNNMLYLPLDRIGRGAGGGASAPDPRAAPAPEAGQVADEVIERLRREAAANRARERR
jgi:membrane protease subunit HflK